MISKEALEYLESRFLTNTEIDLNLEAVALPKDIVVQDLSFLKSFKRRIEAEYRTVLMKDFCEYLKDRREMQDPIAFISTTELKVEAVLDFGSSDRPGHGKHRAFLNLGRNPEWKAVEGIDGTKVPQADFIDWCIDWRDQIKFFDSAEMPITNPTAIVALRRITLDKLKTSEHAVESLKQSQTAMEKIEAKYLNTTPTYIDFEGYPADDLQKRTARLRFDVVLDQKQNDVWIKIRWMQRQTIEKAILLEFRSLLSKLLSGVAIVYLGSIRL